MRSAIFIFASVVLVPFLSLPSAVVAEESFPGIASFAGCSGTDCSACNVVDIVNNGLVWLIGILFIVFAVLMTIAGVRLTISGGNPGALSAAKESFVNGIVGLIIILAAWLIVDTIMRALVGGSGHDGEVGIVSGGTVTGWLAWSKVECYRQVEPEFHPHSNENIDVVEDVVGPGGVLVPGVGANCPPPAASGMVPIPGQTNFVATPATVSNFVAMRSAAAADGITLRVTSAYRSEASQVEIWTRKGCVTNPALCSGTAARPCSYGGNGSNHNSGVALDISVGSSGSATFNWLKANGDRFGFFNNLDSRDPFHWSPSGR